MKVIFLKLQFMIFLLLILLSYGSSAWSAGQLSGSYVNVDPSSSGAEFSIAWLEPSTSKRNVWIGPHLGYLWAGGSGGNRNDFSLGFEGTLWIVNAVGFGFSADFVAPSASNPIHYRFTPSVAVRFLRFGNEGAWAVRFGTPYDTLYHFELALGISLQLGGVPRVGYP